LQCHKLEESLAELGQIFDWIVIDSPPVLPLADTSVWMRVADGALLVVREGKSEKRQIKVGLEAMEDSKLLGVVLNSCSNTDHKKYYQRYYRMTPSNGDHGTQSA
jgi:Mrp family chromosome partitioning ATPase